MKRALYTFSLVLFKGCLSLPSIVNANSDGVMPIQPRSEGAVWIYHNAYFDYGEAIGNGSTVEEVIDTREIEDVTAFQIRLTFEYRSLGEKIIGMPLEEDSYSYFWEYYNESGSYYYEDLDGTGPEEPRALSEFALTLPHPAKLGQTFQIDDAVHKVTAVDELVSVPLGDFFCTVYEVTKLDRESPSREYFYMSPGVGVVRYDWQIKDPEGTGEWVMDVRDELVWYYLPE